MKQYFESLSREISTVDLQLANFNNMYRAIATNMDMEVKVELAAAKRNNEGYSRSPALTESAALVR